MIRSIERRRGNRRSQRGFRFTVLAKPILNQFADPILQGLETIEPDLMRRLVLAYQTWRHQMQERSSPAVAWEFIFRCGDHLIGRGALEQLQQFRSWLTPAGAIPEKL